MAPKGKWACRFALRVLAKRNSSTKPLLPTKMIFGAPRLTADASLVNPHQSDNHILLARM